MILWCVLTSSLVNDFSWLLGCCYFPGACCEFFLNLHACKRHVIVTSALQVFVPSHPLVKHWLAVARNRLSPPPIFRSALAELGRVLIYEAAHDWLPTIDGQVCSPAAALSW